MKTSGWPALVLLATLGTLPARASLLPRPFELDRLNRRLHGRVVDHTNRHGADRRLWSSALGQQRDLYVYLPPGFDPCQRYPVIFWLHGYAQDEHAFLEDVVAKLDEAMAHGTLPRCIIAAPDGSIYGRSCLRSPGSFFLNSKAGRFEDYLMEDVWAFVHERYPIRPEAEAHVLAGVSMGGGAAFCLGLKHRDRVKVVLGLFPPLNTRWMDCHGNYRANFDPNCWSWRTDVSRSHETVARFYGVFTVPLRRLIDPLYERNDPATLEELSRENPIEMLDRLDLKEGELDMYAAYGGKDQFNIDAQVESFLYAARCRGLTVGVGYEPRGRHDAATAAKLRPAALAWLAPRLAPYAP